MGYHITMKVAPTLLFALSSAAEDEKKVPPRHPLQRLNRLVEFSAEILNDWYTFLPSQEKWIDKFAVNAERMERNFNRGNQRCGYYDANSEHGGPAARKRREELDADQIWDRYDRDDPSIGTKQITTGFRKWAERYISTCSGQRNYSYQVNRMNKWNNLLQQKLAAYYVQ